MRFRPSAAHRWLGGGCTGSVKAEAAALSLPSGPQADEGTRLHGVAADMLVGDVKECAPEDWEIIGDYVSDVLNTQAAHPGSELKIEHSLSHPDHPGKVDASLRTSSRLITWDLKTGRRPVEVVRNHQLLLYADMADVGPGMTHELRIAQTPGGHPDGPVRSWTVTDLTPYRLQRDRAVAEAKGAEARLVATPSNCLYCKAVTSCPAARNVTLGGMDLAMGQVGPLAANAVRSELVTLRNTAKMVNDRLVALEAEAEVRIKRGELIDGCMLAPGKNGSLAWSADDDRVKAICGMVGQDPVEAPKLRTPAQMIKAGVPAELVATVAKRSNPKMTVSTDVAAQAKKLFPS